MIINEIRGSHLYSTFDSLNEFADYCEPLIPAYARTHTPDEWIFGKEDTRSSFYDACTMAREGWNFYLDTALNLVDDIAETVKDVMVDDFRPVWDVQGSTVDIGQYLAGEPECMIDFPPVKSTKSGHVVTICASISTSGSVSAESMIKRGVVIAALATILAQRGMNLELWADWTTGPKAGKTAHFRVLVKGANDIIDHSRILYAVANPSMLRVLGFAAMHGMPQNWQTALNVGHGYGRVCDPEHDLPEGTIYPKSVRSSYDYDTTAELMSYLRQIGLLEED